MGNSVTSLSAQGDSEIGGQTFGVKEDMIIDFALNSRRFFTCDFKYLGVWLKFGDREYKLITTFF